MKVFKDLVVVKRPREEIWQIMRDRLPELAGQLDDIDRIELVEREAERERKHRLTNRWVSRQSIPTVLASQLGGTEISWLDENEWDDERYVCDWSITPSILTDAIRCRGSSCYEKAMGGRGTRVTFEGEFELLSGSESMPRILEGPLNGFVESIVTTLIPKNLRKVLDAAAESS